MADELIAPIESLERPVVRISVDGFHRPRSQRVHRGADSPEGYYHDSFDHAAIWREVLEPLGSGGSRRYRTAVFDFRTDRPVDAPQHIAPPDAVVLFDGVFLLRPELNDGWDERIFVHTDFEVALVRALDRDGDLFGSVDQIESRYRTRYIPGERMYLEAVNPRRLANVVVLNNVPSHPEIV